MQQLNTLSSEIIGAHVWAIPEGYIPSITSDYEEAVCLLNAGGAHADVEITILFGSREPLGPYRATVPSLRLVRLCFNELFDPEPLPRDTPYSAVIESDEPIVVQHTRLNTRPPALVLASTFAHPFRVN